MSASPSLAALYHSMGWTAAGRPRVPLEAPTAAPSSDAGPSLAQIYANNGWAVGVDGRFHPPGFHATVDHTGLVIAYAVASVAIGAAAALATFLLLWRYYAATFGVWGAVAGLFMAGFAAVVLFVVSTLLWPVMLLASPMILGAIGERQALDRRLDISRRARTYGAEFRP